jgi:hypothetical protein
LPTRRFPPPWTAEVTPNCFIVRDANGQALSYSKDEARRIAANFAKLSYGFAACSSSFPVL